MSMTPPPVHLELPDRHHLAAQALSPEELRKLEAVRICLEAAVPLLAHQFRHLSFAELRRIADAARDVLIEPGGEHLFFAPTCREERGLTARAFNALAKAVAILSFQPRGVKVFGLHFDYTRLRAWDAAEGLQGPGEEPS